MGVAICLLVILAGFPVYAQDPDIIRGYSDFQNLWYTETPIPVNGTDPTPFFGSFFNGHAIPSEAAGAVTNGDETIIQSAIGQPFFSGEGSYFVDMIPPEVVAVVAVTATPTHADTLEFTVSFSEDVEGMDDAGDLSIDTSGGSASYTGVAVSGGPQEYGVELTGVSGDGPVALSVVVSGGVRDVKGNALVASALEASVVVDNTPPLVAWIIAETSSPTTGTMVQYAVGFSETVVGFFDEDDVLVFAPPSLTYSTLTVAGGPVEYTVSLNGLAGDGDVQVMVRTDSDVLDLAGHGLIGTLTSPRVTVDNTPPIAVCQDITVQLEAPGTASITGGDVDGGSTDNGGIASLEVSPNSFSCADVGPNTVTLTVTDASSNTATCQATVTVESNIYVVQSPMGDPNPVPAGAAVSCSVVANDLGGGVLSYLWSAPEGVFDDPTLPNPVWTAPEVCGGDPLSVPMSLHIESTSGCFEDVGYVQEVTPDVSVIAILEGPSISADPVSCGAQAQLHVLAESSCGDPVTYEWSDDCGGLFDDPFSSDPVWTAPDAAVVCTLEVTVSAPGADPVRVSVGATVVCGCGTTSLTVDDVVGTPGSEVTIPIRVADAPNDVAAFRFDFEGDACTGLTFARFEIAGTLLENWSYVDVNLDPSGVVTVGGFTVEDVIPAGASGELIRLVFTVSSDSQPGETCTLCLSRFADDIAAWLVCCGELEIGCCPDGDVNLDCEITPGDALLTFQHSLGIIDLPLSQQQHADVDDPQSPPQITPGDALCIFQYSLGMPSCLDAMPFPQACSCQDGP